MAAKLSRGSSCPEPPDDDDNGDEEDPQTQEDFAAFRKWLDSQAGGEPQRDDHPSAAPAAASSSLPGNEQKDPAAAVPAWASSYGHVPIPGDPKRNPTCKLDVAG
jgi:hypothetical protein